VACTHTITLVWLPRWMQDVELQNAGAWASLTAAPAGAAAPAAAAPPAGEGGGGGGEDDNLWTEFQGREAQQLQVRGGSCWARRCAALPASEVGRALLPARRSLVCHSLQNASPPRLPVPHCPPVPFVRQAEEAKKAAEEAERRRKEEERQTLLREAQEVRAGWGRGCVGFLGCMRAEMFRGGWDTEKRRAWGRHCHAVRRPCCGWQPAPSPDPEGFCDAPPGCRCPSLESARPTPACRAGGGPQAA
jgi:ribosomal protein L12E/L44/L45/RPP1/RPP2